MAYERKPRGATEQERIVDAVSRMAAVLVLAAGGEIRVPHRMMAEADYIELEQSDRESGVTVYRARPHRRIAGEPIIEGQVVDAEVSPKVIDKPLLTKPFEGCGANARVLPGLPHKGER